MGESLEECACFQARAKALKGMAEARNWLIADAELIWTDTANQSTPTWKTCGNLNGKYWAKGQIILTGWEDAPGHRHRRHHLLPTLCIFHALVYHIIKVWIHLLHLAHLVLHFAAAALALFLPITNPGLAPGMTTKMPMLSARWTMARSCSWPHTP